MVRTQSDKFWSRVKRGKSTECWPWQGELNSMGYGRLSTGGRKRRVRILAHKLSLELHGIVCPPNKIILHSCDNPKCVNPQHLRIGTMLENADDARQKKRNNYGERNGMARFTEDQIRNMHALRRNGSLLREIATMYGTGKHYVGQIISGRRWGHLA